MAGSASISVIIPTRNRAQLVERAVSSALADPDVEVDLVVVDDASTDATPDVLAAFGDRIRVIRNDERRERGASRNRGTRASRHQRLAFLDSDDAFAPGALAVHAASSGVSVLGWQHVDDRDRLVGPPVLPGNDAVSRLDLENRLGPTSVVALDRTLFDRVGGFPEEFEVQGSEDWLLWHRLREAGARFHLVRRSLVHIRLHEGNSTSDPRQLERSMWAAAVSIGDPVGCARTAGVVARNFAGHREWRQAARWLARSWVVPPEGVRATARTASSATRALLR